MDHVKMKLIAIEEHLLTKQNQQETNYLRNNDAFPKAIILEQRFK